MHTIEFHCTHRIYKVQSCYLPRIDEAIHLEGNCYWVHSIHHEVRSDSSDQDYLVALIGLRETERPATNGSCAAKLAH